MNKQNRLIIDLLKASNEKYSASLTQICENFITQRDKAKSYSSRFKDENAIFVDQMKDIIAEDRAKIHEAQNDLSEVYAKQVGKLEESMQESLVHALNMAFVQRLSFYQTTGIAPTRSEIESLVTLASGHLVCLAGIDRILENNHSDYRLRYTSIPALESDLEALRKFSKLVPAATNIEQAKTLSEILGDMGKSTTVTPRGTGFAGIELPGETLSTSMVSKGEPVKRLVNGKAIQTGAVYDFALLNSEALIFQKMESALDEMSIRWADVTTPAIELLSKEIKSDDNEISGTEVVESEDKSLALVKELGAQAALWKEPTNLDDYAK